ncbi:MAG: response regulator [Gemmataceae bacterium]|nr:response regulator [Gemmataceae bacterium]
MNCRDVSTVRSSPPLRVLVVEDDRDCAESTALLLDLAGYVVDVAFTGEEALARARENVPDVVLLDLGLPGTNGYEVARRLRAMDLGRQVLIVAITGYGRDEDRAGGEAAGVHLHFLKPVEPAWLLALLAQVQQFHARAAAGPEPSALPPPRALELPDQTEGGRRAGSVSDGSVDQTVAYSSGSSRFAR